MSDRPDVKKRFLLAGQFLLLSLIGLYLLRQPELAADSAVAAAEIVAVQVLYYGFLILAVGSGLLFLSAMSTAIVAADLSQRR